MQLHQCCIKIFRICSDLTFSRRIADWHEIFYTQLMDKWWELMNLEDAEHDIEVIDDIGEVDIFLLDE